MANIIILVSAEQVTGVDLVPHIIKATIIAVGYNSMAALFEHFKVIYDFAAEECTAILQSRLIDYDRCTPNGFDVAVLSNAISPIYSISGNQFRTIR